MPDQERRRRHRLRQAAEEEAHRLHEHDAEAEGDQQLVLVRAGIEVADDHPLHHHADQHDEQRAGNDGDDEGAGIGVGDPAGIAAEHEHRAVREIEDAERAVDDRQAGRDQRQKGAEHHAVEHLRNKIGPVDHAVVRNLLRRIFAAGPIRIRPGNRQVAGPQEAKTALRALDPASNAMKSLLRISDAEKAFRGRQV